MEKPDEYAAAAAVYAEADRLPIRVLAEFPTFLRVLGSIEGAEVLDLACGAGLISRLLVAHGARRVVGVDVSPAMIEQARALTPPDAPIEYRVSDAGAVDAAARFDVVTGAFLLNYAASRAELARLCATIARSLRRGGRFVGTVPNSDHRPDRSFATRYGVHYPWPPGIADGDRYTFELHLSRVIAIDCFYWTLGTYRRELERAGLTDVAFAPWLPTAAGLDEMGEEFWADWIANPIAVVVSARRG